MEVDEPKPAAAAAAAADKAAAGAAADDTKDKVADSTSADAAAEDGSKAAAAADGSTATKQEGKDSKEQEKEPSSFTLTAPCRVVPNQVKHISLAAGDRRVDCRFGHKATVRKSVRVESTLSQSFEVYDLLAGNLPYECG